MLDYNKITQWWTTTTNKDNVVVDNVIVKFKDSNVVNYYTFRRIRCTYYDELKLDYSEVYVKRIEFVMMLKSLNKVKS